MIGIRGPATTVRNTCPAAAGLLAAVHANILATSLLGGALLLISILAIAAGLSKKKERRDAAYKVLRLILYTIRRPGEPFAYLPPDKTRARFRRRLAPSRADERQCPPLV